MRSNPFRLTLAVIGIGGLGLGIVFWLIGQAGVSTSASESTAVLGAIGGWLVAVGWLPFLAWLLVGALRWVPTPEDEDADDGDTRPDGRPKTEAEIRAILKAKRDAG